MRKHKNIKKRGENGDEETEKRTGNHIENSRWFSSEGSEVAGTDW
jgi:hypothetical protein